MKLIAVEEHLLIPEVREAWADPASAPDPATAFDAGEIGRRLDDLGDGRLALMDEAGVDVQVLSLTTPGLHNLEAHRAVALARRVNDRLAEAVVRRPDRFQGFAALPTPAPDEAPRELERAVCDLGLKGAMLCGRTRERNLDHPAFRPLLEQPSHRPVRRQDRHGRDEALRGSAASGLGSGRRWLWAAVSEGVMTCPP